jgi:hypothetical protein
MKRRKRIVTDLNRASARVAVGRHEGNASSRALGLASSLIARRPSLTRIGMSDVESSSRWKNTHAETRRRKEKYECLHLLSKEIRTLIDANALI